MTAINELYADIVKLNDFGQNFTLGSPVSSHGGTVPTQRVLSILDYAPKTEDNPFTLSENVHIVYERRFKKGDWIWARHSFHSPSSHYDGMRITDIYTEITGLIW